MKKLQTFLGTIFIVSLSACATSDTDRETARSEAIENGTLQEFSVNDPVHGQLDFLVRPNSFDISYERVTFVVLEKQNGVRGRNAQITSQWQDLVAIVQQQAQEKNFCPSGVKEVTRVRVDRSASLGLRPLGSNHIISVYCN